MEQNKLKHTKLSQINLLKILGPGLITGASDDDPSGIVTYSQAGARFGLMTLWTAWLTFPLMFVIQEICARIGLVTSKGLITNLKDHYHFSIILGVLLLMLPALILNIAADLAAMGGVTHLLIPRLSTDFFCIAYALIILTIMIFASYQKIVNILKYLCLVLIVYFFVPFSVKQNWLSIFKNTVIPTIHFNKSFMEIFVAILGTTISPYLFFWQTTLEAEEKRHKNREQSIPIEITKMRMDVGFGMFVTNLVMYFIILTTGTVLFNKGMTNIDTLEQTARALEPLVGEFSYLLFAIGVIGTGLLAIPVFSSCCAYLLTSSFNLKEGLDKKYYEAKLFYLIMSVAIFIALLFNFLELNPIKMLIWTAVLYGLCAPPLILLILFISNNKKIMKNYCNSKFTNFMAGIAFIIMTFAGLSLLYFHFA